MNEPQFDIYRYKRHYWIRPAGNTYAVAMALTLWGARREVQRLKRPKPEPQFIERV